MKRRSILSVIRRARLRATHIALAISIGAQLSPFAQAQSAPQETSVRLKYVHYHDYQEGRDSRMRINSPMLWLNTPLAEDWEFEGSAVIDSTSGASPLYLDSLTGASGKGIQDNRYAGDLKVTKYFENYSIGVGGAWSDEDDYLSRNGMVEGRYWTEDKNTTFSAGVSTDWDGIGSTNNADLAEGRNTQHYLLGVTQVLTPESIMQMNLTYSYGHGYWNDPYKTADVRPKDREQWALLTRYNQYIEALDAALHLDYRFYTDSWDVHSHTVAARLYQPVGKYLTVVPLLRYYVQDEASFFSGSIPETFEDKYLSLDTRLGSYGSVTLGVKLLANVGSKTEIDLLYEFVDSSRRFKPGDESGDWKDIYAHYVEVGLLTKF